ncbi:MAG TPA: formate dehydrogenase accessory sulfurtransferase FdhD [Candidatus Acidoferrales bacterium]
MSDRKSSVFLTQVIEWKDGRSHRVDDYLAAESPLEIRVNDRLYGITLRTPGNDADLAAGLLYSEGVIADRAQILSVAQKATQASDANSANLVSLSLAEDVVVPASNAERHFSAGSACGLCGKAAIDDLRARGVRHPERQTQFDAKVLCSLPDKLRMAQANFGRTGGLHAAALFSATGDLDVIREDIGRHNTVDKVVGWALQNDRLPLSGKTLLVSGRGGFEIVQKAIVAGVPVLASISAPSSLAVQLAREFGLTLVGFLRGERFIIYSGEDRLLQTSEVGRISSSPPQ